jgi:hypothetical protein
MRFARSMPTRYVALLLSAATATVYLWGFRYFSIGDTLPAELLPISILERGTLDFDTFSEKDAVQPYYFVVKEDRVISLYPIVPGLLNVPAHVVAKAAGLDRRKNADLLAKWTASLATTGSVLFLFLALTHVCIRRRTAVLFALLYAFGTVAWSVCTLSLWQHGPSLLFLSAAFWLLVRPDSRWLPLAGFSLGMAVFDRPANLVFALPLTVYVLLHRRHRLVPFLAAAAVPAVFLLWYSEEYWGSIFAMGQGQRYENHFETPLWFGLASVLFSPNRGLFIFSPVFFFSLPAVYLVVKRRATAPFYLYLGIGLILDLILYARWSLWWGGWSFGYRMLSEMAPGMMLLLALAWEKWFKRRWWLQVAFCLAAVASLYVNFLGARYYIPNDWNAMPVSVDAQPSRNWDWRDTQLRRSQRMFFHNLKRRVMRSIQ